MVRELRLKVFLAGRVAVETDDVMASVGEERGEDRTDVAEMTRDEDAHVELNPCLSW